MDKGQIWSYYMTKTTGLDCGAWRTHSLLFRPPRFFHPSDLQFAPKLPIKDPSIVSEILFSTFSQSDYQGDRHGYPYRTRKLIFSLANGSAKIVHALVCILSLHAQYVAYPFKLRRPVGWSHGGSLERETEIYIFQDSTFFAFLQSVTASDCSDRWGLWRHKSSPMVVNYNSVH